MFFAEIETKIKNRLLFLKKLYILILRTEFFFIYRMSPVAVLTGR